MRGYSKCIAAFLSAFATTLAVNHADWVSALLVGLAAGATTYIAPKNADV